MEMLDNLPEDKFRQQLNLICNAAVKTVLMTKDEYFKLIEDLKEASTAASKNRRQYYILKRFENSLNIEVLSFIFTSSSSSYYNIAFYYYWNIISSIIHLFLYIF